jgi:uncharacterized protein YgiB involved in biofilm formation
MSFHAYALNQCKSSAMCDAAVTAVSAIANQRIKAGAARVMQQENCDHQFKSCTRDDVLHQWASWRIYAGGRRSQSAALT